MTLSTPVKAVSGLALTSAGAAGTALAYKYSTDLYEIEKEAIEAKEGWTITKLAAAEGQNKKLDISVKTKSTDENKGWTCTLMLTVPSDGSITEADIKEDLKKFLTVDISTGTNPQTTTTIDKKHREGLVTSCSRNRNTGDKQSHSKVTAKLTILLTLSNDSKYKFKEGDLKTVFEGQWINSADTK